MTLLVLLAGAAIGMAATVVGLGWLSEQAEVRSELARVAARDRLRGVETAAMARMADVVETATWPDSATRPLVWPSDRRAESHPGLDVVEGTGRDVRC